MPTPGEAQWNDGYYELRPTPNKGNGAFALKDIKAGTKILVDNALFKLSKPENLIADTDIIREYLALSLDGRNIFDNLPTFNPESYTPDSQRWLGKFHSNKFKMANPALLGCFAHASRFNHSCAPNCCMTSTMLHQQHCYVITDVKQGEELTFCYGEALLFQTTAQRYVSMMSEVTGSSCLCTLCTLPRAQRERSDTLRRIMRCLLFIVSGQDIASNTKWGFLKFIPNLTKQIMTFDHCTRYCVVWPYIYFAQLAESEGILASKEVRLAYTRAIAIMLRHAQEMSVDHFPADTVVMLREWAAKARLLKQNSCDPALVGHRPWEEDFEQMCAAVDSIVLMEH